MTTRSSAPIRRASRSSRPTSGSCASKGDSVGARVTAIARNVPVGLGEPMFDRIDADLAHAMMGINAVKAVEIGDGVAVAAQLGSEHRDELTPGGFRSNHAGGTLGGITTGQDLVVHVALKPTSSIQVPGQHHRRGRQPGRGRHHRPARSLRRPARRADRRGDAAARADGSRAAPPRAVRRRDLAHAGHHAPALTWPRAREARGRVLLVLRRARPVRPVLAGLPRCARLRRAADRDPDGRVRGAAHRRRAGLRHWADTSGRPLAAAAWPRRPASPARSPSHGSTRCSRSPWSSRCTARCGTASCPSTTRTCWRRSAPSRRALRFRCGYGARSGSSTSRGRGVLGGERVMAMPWLLAAMIGCTWLALAGLGPAPAVAIAARRRRSARPCGTARARVPAGVVPDAAEPRRLLRLPLAVPGAARLLATVIGALWAWAVAAEIGVFLLARELLARFSLQGLVVAASGDHGSLAAHRRVARSAGRDARRPGRPHGELRPLSPVRGGSGPAAVPARGGGARAGAARQHRLRARGHGRCAGRRLDMAAPRPVGMAFYGGAAAAALLACWWRGWPRPATARA
jgi:hypothetical protein